MGGNYTALLQASKNICPYPLIAAEQLGMWPPNMPDSIKFYRFCYDGCCMPCPSQEFLASYTSLSLSHWDDTRRLVAGSFALSIVSLVAVFLLVLTVLVLPRHMTRYNIFIVAYAFAAAFLCIGHSISVANFPQDICYDEITSANQLNNASCAVGGLVLVFGLYWTVMLSLEVALLMHLSVVWGCHRRKYEAHICFVINTAVSVSIVCINAVVGMSYQDGMSCTARRSTGSYALHIPLVPMSSTGFLLQISTFVYATVVILRAGQKEDLTTWASETTVGIRNDKRSSPSRLALNRTTKASYWVRKAMIRSLCLQWRPLLVTTWTVVVDLLTCAVFLIHITEAPPSEHLVTDWVQCVVTTASSSATPQSDCLRKLNVDSARLAWWAYHVPMYLVACNGLVAATWEFRFTMVRGWILVVKNPRSFWTLEEWKATTRQQPQRDQHTVHSTSTENIHSADNDIVHEDEEIDMERTLSDTYRGFDDLELNEIGGHSEPRSERFA